MGRGNWWIAQKRLQGNALLKKGLLDVTLYDGWEGNAVDPTGARDSTKALQQAINDARDHALVVFFPSGTYQISDTLSCMKKAKWSEKLKRWQSWEERLTTVLLGSTKGPRPVLRLIDNAPGFGDPAHLKPAVIIWDQLDGTRANGWKELSRPLPDAIPDRSPPPVTCDIMEFGKTSRGDCGFNQQFRGIDIYIGAGNPGAVGLAANGAQGCSTEDCKVTAYGAYAGFYDMPGAGAGGVNLEVDGGRFGIVIPGDSSSPVIAGVTLRDQTEAALDVPNEWTPTTVAGFRIIKATGPVLIMKHSPTADVCLGGCAVSLVDGSIELANNGSAAINNTVGESLYLHNVYVSGANEVIQSGQQPPVRCAKGLTLVKDYAFANPKTSAMLLNSNDRTNEMISATPATFIPSDLLSRNAWNRLPSFEDADAKCVTDEDIGATGDGKTDDTAALQRAIDKFEKVFLPNGKYVVSKTLVLHKNTKFFGVAKGHVLIQPSATWLPVVETPILQTDDSAEGSAYLGDLGIGFNALSLEHDVFNCLTWRLGRRSIIKSVSGVQYNAFIRPRSETGDHQIIIFAGNGGGRWYFWPEASTIRHANQGDKFRLMSIIGTHEPLSFYGFNPEHSETTPQVEMIGASNVRVFGTKVESRQNDVFQITDCDNILMAGFGGHSGVRDGGSVYRLKNSTNVELALAGSSRPNAKGFVVTESGINEKPVSLGQKRLLVLLKQGEVNDQAWVPDKINSSK